MSLTTPITNADVSMGGQGSGYAPVPTEQPQFSGGGSPSLAVGAKVGSQSVAFWAAGWLVLGILGVWALHEWGFRFAHVP